MTVREWARKFEAAILGYLATRPEGASAVAIAAALGAPERRTGKRMQKLKGQGLVCFCGIPAHGVWALAEHAKVATEALESKVEAKKAITREKENARKRYLYSTRLERPAPQIKQPEPEWEDIMPEHRIVSAHDVPRLPKPGPASVWELAA